MIIQRCESSAEHIAEQSAGERITSSELLLRCNRGEPDAVHKGSKQLLWFISLWIVGVISTAVLVLPFHFLISLAIHR
jgi:hypothetical protein